MSFFFKLSLFKSPEFSPCFTTVFHPVFTRYSSTHSLVPNGEIEGWWVHAEFPDPWKRITSWPWASWVCLVKLRQILKLHGDMNGILIHVINYMIFFGRLYSILRILHFQLAYMCIYIYIYIWLVVDLPSEKYARQLGWFFPIYGKS
jgi:hypothetical protein